jgi:peptidoglycan/xylan/chitin deacetylase (PgdA/CDA1 family)
VPTSGHNGPVMRRRLGQLVKAASAAYDVARPSGAGLAVLLYHRVGARTPVSVDLPAGLFADQMALLADRYQVLTLDQAADQLASGAPPRGKPAVAITFDDGTADFLEEAVPVLVEHGLPATLYVATAFVEEQRSFPDDGRPATWAALADAVATGLVTIGSHTHTHLLLDRTDGPTAADELDRSIDLNGERLGVGAQHFAYPKALAGSPAAATEVGRRFRTAAVAGTRLNRWAGTDLHQLARTPIQVTDGLRWFERKADGGLRLEDQLRRRVNRKRYAGATT